ncbi:c22-sterol desaturase [Ceraceosorus bombacis]|uniref:sterol 22-desaturase n=1 Tax=Ceraceosorus bombacis TaxID=401625 RepID=A0A0P1BLM1_9BASI|nr:c22-sterol desaturase [Ceraceosorus bombacis]
MSRFSPVAVLRGNAASALHKNASIPMAAPPTAPPSVISSLYEAFMTASPTTVALSIACIIATGLLYEQYRYQTKKAGLPGPKWTIPIIGKFADSLNPTMENYIKGWNSGPLSVASVFHIFIVIASSTEHTRKILNSPAFTEPCLVASAKKVLCHDNWVFLNGKVHVDYRKGLNTLFTRKALGIYLGIQESIYRRHFKAWLDDPDPKPQPYMMQFRDLNMETSLRVFCGDYISDEGAKEISDKYWLITVALELVNFPFAFPGTKVYNAIKARKVAMKWFEHTAAESKKRMAAGGEVTCLADAWIKAMVEAREGEADSESRRVLVRDYSDREIGMVLLSFLFASQDAMSSGLTYLFQHVADHPEVLRKVREEQYNLRGHDVTAPLDLDTLEKMEYTRVVVKESLRLKPPVIMVPYSAHQDFKIDEGYTVPKGSMVIPSFWNALHDPQAYPDPDAFIPERWQQGPQSPAEKHPRNWLVFGSGPHNCIGQQYALLHLTAVLGSASVLMNWEHEITPKSEKVRVIATIFPQDGARIKFTPRAAPAPGTAPAIAAAA